MEENKQPFVWTIRSLFIIFLILCLAIAYLSNWWLIALIPFVLGTVYESSDSFCVFLLNIFKGKAFHWKEHDRIINYFLMKQEENRVLGNPINLCLSEEFDHGVMDEKAGKKFLETMLEPSYKRAKRENKYLFIDLDRFVGFSSGFFKESFGKLAEKCGAKKLLEALYVKCKDEPLLTSELIWVTLKLYEK